MTKEEIEIGKCYSCKDDALYNVVATGKDWVCVLHYSYNHCVCTAEFHDYEFFKDLQEETEQWMYDIFCGLRLDKKWDYLTDKED